MVYISILLLLVFLAYISLNKKRYVSLDMFLAIKAQYLKGELWRLKRKAVLIRDSHTCQICGSKHNLEIHHDSGYDLIPFEPISCLRTLCNSCHHTLHQTIGFPQTVEEYFKWSSHEYKPQKSTNILFRITTDFNKDKKK